MTPDNFWTSLDGRILAVSPVSEQRLKLTLAFTPRHPAEEAFMQAHAERLSFTERSTLARIGIEMIPSGKPVFIKHCVLLEAEAFLYDESFPHAAYWRDLLVPGTPVGRLFHAPASAKLDATAIWEAVRANRLKLPDTISIDRHGRVFLTPHPVHYTLNPALTRDSFERLVSGEAGRSYLDKVQVRHHAAPLAIAPRAGVLTSCSMYLKEHYVVLNQGEGNFGIHTSAVLLDPVKTNGTNIMLEIYNHGDQPVVNPMVSVDIFRAPGHSGERFNQQARHRDKLTRTAAALYKGLDELEPVTAHARPRTTISVRGQDASMPNHSLLLNADEFDQLRSGKRRLPARAGCPTVVQALASAPAGADTLVVDFFPNLMEQIELLTRLPKLKLRRLIFRQASRTHGFFLSSNAHARLDTFDALGLEVYWFNPQMGDLYLHTYKKGHGFFIRQEMARRFQECTIFAFYGSNAGLDAAQTERISELITRLSAFIGPNVGVLTGGGAGVMRLATEQAREHGALTGACFLELEAQPPEFGVDFFNTFQETSRHFRQKWFEAADFCIFNVGGVGTLEEIGIELCNLKLGIRPRVPYTFFDAAYFDDLRRQIERMIADKRAPAWMADYILFSDKPEDVVAFYRKTLKVL